MENLVDISRLYGSIIFCAKELLFPRRKNIEIHLDSVPCCTWCCFAVMVETVVAAEADLALPPLPPIPPPPPPRPPEEQTAGRTRRFSMLVVVWLACRGNELLKCMCLVDEEDLSTFLGLF